MFIIYSWCFNWYLSAVFFCSPRYWIFNMIGCTPLKAKRSKREVFSAFECSLSLLTVGGNWQWSPQSTNCLQPWQIGTNVAGSVACDASSISTSWGRRIWDIGWRWKVHHLTPRVSKKYQLSHKMVWFSPKSPKILNPVSKGNWISFKRPLPALTAVQHTTWASWIALCRACRRWM